ncbi:MAG TPA: anti-sigma factor [Cellvibrionaceae bacterium]
MNYLNEDRNNALAAAYVLGTLQGGARLRFSRLLMQSALLRSALWRWEAHLNTLGASLAPQTPSPEVWQTIQQRLNFIASSQVVLPTPVVSLPERSAPVWQWLTGLATAAALVLAVVLFTLPQLPTEQGQVALIQGEKAQALWLIKLHASGLEITASSTFLPQADHDYELWMLAADGRPPVSLGLLPKSGRVKLPRSALFDQVQVAALAVSLEPLGGSPNGQPSTVLYTAQLMTL